MAHLYGGFQEEDQIEQENDADIGALGSILSWDEEEQDDSDDDSGITGGAGNDNNNARTSGDGGGGTSTTASGVKQPRAAPPDMVQFSMKDGIPQFNFLSGNSSNGIANTSGLSLQQQSSVPQQSEQPGAAAVGLTMQLPMPTPISNMQNNNGMNNPLQQQQQAVPPSAAQMMNTLAQGGGGTQQPQPVGQRETTQQSQQQQALAATFAQFLAQQTGALFQQQQQQQQQQSNDMNNAGQMMQQLIQAQQQASQQQQQPTPQQPQQAQNQLPFTADPNAFLQQLQLAQLQQQMQMAQQQQQQQQQQPQGQSKAPVQQQQRKRSVPSTTSVNESQQPFSSQGRPPLAIAPTTTASRPVEASTAKKARTTKAPNKTSSASASKKEASPSKGRAAAKVGIVSASDTDGEGSKKSKKKAPSKDAASSSIDDGLSEGDKAQANRDRNREHARNTRLRKKAYLEKLKATVDELCKERDTLVSERAGAASLLVEMHNTRTEVLMSFFALRSTNEKRRKLWSSILDESCFSCVMPVTPYRSFPASEVQVSKCQRTILGIDAMMADTASLHVLFSSLVDRMRFPNGKVEFRYTLVTEESVVAGNQMMARWVMSTTNATELGARMEVAKQGMLCCKFNSSHRIVGLELMFDVMAFMLQLKQAAGSDNFPVIPNTVQTCQRLFDKPMVLTLAEPPYTIVQVNKLWEDMTGYAAEEVVGKVSCKILQGSATSRQSVDDLMQEVRYKRPCSTLLSNVKKSGEVFRHYLVVFPLSTDSRITHYLALSTPNVGEDLPTNEVGGSGSSVALTQPMGNSAKPVLPQQEVSPAITAPTGYAASQSGENPQNGGMLPNMLMNSSPNPLMLPSQTTSMANFSLNMAPPPSRK